MGGERWLEQHKYSANQATLWPEFEPERELTIQERFEIFHEDNPDVYEFLLEKARAANLLEYKTGMKCFWEMLRWHTFMVVKKDQSTFKLNNDFTSRYARLLMDENSELDGYFEIRELKS